jgi:GTP-binding protein
MKINFRKTIFWGVAAEMSSCPPMDRPEVVLSGKSNVGKSSLLNALADNKKLARVSQAPGKTRLVVYFDVDQKIYIADLPGYGYSKAPKDIKEKFSKLADQYFTSGRPIVLTLHLIDIRHAPSKEDMQMLSYMNEQKIPYFIVFTKCDKFSRAQREKRLAEQMDAFDVHDQAHCYAVSAEKKEGLEDLQQAIADFVFPDI